MAVFPLLNVREDTYHKAFLINSIIAGVAAGLILEYKYRDPFHIYRKEESQKDVLFNVSATVLLAILVAYIAYWVTRALFGFGDSTLVLKERNV